MGNFWARRGVAYVNEMNQSLGALLGIATGHLSDSHLSDSEIAFLHNWLEQHTAIATTWPGDVICSKVRAILADGHVSEEERAHLTDTLQKLVGGHLEELAASTHVTQLAFDDVTSIIIPGKTYCLTGDFAFAPRSLCEKEITSRGGTVKSGVSKKVDYLVVGGLGSAEWKHGSFGTKLEKAMAYKREGVPILVVHEELWTRAL